MTEPHPPRPTGDPPRRAALSMIEVLLRYRLAALALLALEIIAWTPGLSQLVFTPGDIVVSTAVVLATVLCIGWAEQRIGRLRTAAVAVLAPASAVALSSVLLTLGSEGGEAFSSAAVHDRLWSTSSITVAVLMAAARGFDPSRRRAVRMLLLCIVIAAVLYNGHGVDLVRAFSALGGSMLGRYLVPESRTLDWQHLPAGRGRAAAIAPLVLVLTGWLLTVFTPDATGALAPLGMLLTLPVTVLILADLVVATLLMLRGRRLGVYLALPASAALTVMVAYFFTVTPLTDSWFTWDGASLGDLEWQLALMLLWVVPAFATLSLVRSLGHFAGRRSSSLGAQRDRLADLIAHSDAGSMAHMGTWAGNEHWFTEDGRGGVAFRVANAVAVTVSDPISARGGEAEVIEQFARFCSSRALIPAFYSVHEEHLPVFAQLGWAVTPVGEESIIDLATFSTAGKKKTDLRTATNRALREGVRAQWCVYRELPDALRAAVDAVARGWVEDRRLPEMGFTLGGLRELDDPAVLLLLAIDRDGTVHGLTSWLPAHREGVIVGRTLDVMRRGSTAVPGVIEFLIATAANDLRDEGLEYLSLSGTPLAKAHTAPPTTALARAVDRVMLAAGRVLEPAYSFTSLMRFKDKFQPCHRTLYLAYPGAADLPAIGRALTKAYVPTLSARHLVGLLRPIRTPRAEVRATTP